MKTWYFGIVLGMIVMMLACSQKDPDAMDAGASQAECKQPAQNKVMDFSALAVGKSYYPLVEGAKWVYRHEGGSTVWEENIVLEAATDGSGDLVSVDTPGPSGSHTKSVLTVDGQYVYRAKKEVYVGDTLDSRVEYDPGFARFDMSWLAVETGCTLELSYARKEWDGYGVLQRDGDRSHVYSVVKTDASVSVPAGKFKGCLVIERARLSGTALASDEEDNKEFTFCPGVGKVLEKELLTGKTESLTSCDIPGGKCP